MNKEYMTDEEFKKQLEELFGDDLLDVDDERPYEDKEVVSGNPYGAGFYTFIRSAEDSSWMMMGEEARFDPDSNTWFEYMGCGYACERDGIGLQEADEIDMYHFHKEHPQMKCRETFF